MKLFSAILLGLGLVLVHVGDASAGRVPMVRTDGQRVRGARPDIRVPYLNNYDSGFGAYSVAVRIYKSPEVGAPAWDAMRPVYNLPFYGAVQGIGSRSDGAMPRPTTATGRTGARHGIFLPQPRR